MLNDFQVGKPTCAFFTRIFTSPKFWMGLALLLLLTGIILSSVDTTPTDAKDMMSNGITYKPELGDKLDPTSTLLGWSTALNVGAGVTGAGALAHAFYMRQTGRYYFKLWHFGALCAVFLLLIGMAFANSSVQLGAQNGPGWTSERLALGLLTLVTMGGFGFGCFVFRDYDTVVNGTKATDKTNKDYTVLKYDKNVFTLIDENNNLVKKAREDLKAFEKKKPLPSATKHFLEPSAETKQAPFEAFQRGAYIANRKEGAVGVEPERRRLSTNPVLERLLVKAQCTADGDRATAESHRCLSSSPQRVI